MCVRAFAFGVPCPNRDWAHGCAQVCAGRTFTCMELSPKPISLPSRVTHADVVLERRERLGRLAGALRIFGRLGFGEGVAGHVTVRDPEFKDLFWVNPLGVSFKLMRVSDLICVNRAGEVVHGERPVNRAAFVIHSAIHEARPDVEAAAHAHSVYGKAFSSLRRPLRPLTQDACVFYEDHDVVLDGGGRVVFDEESAQALAAGFRGKAAIHANHGLLTVGHSVDEAAFWFVTLERSCQAQLLAEAAGEPFDIPHAWASQTRDLIGGHSAGWLGFQPLWQELLAYEPDFLL